MTTHPPNQPFDVNETFAALGLLNWKPLLSAVLLPPVPLLLLLVLGSGLRRTTPMLGRLLIWSSLVGLWLSHCSVTGQWLEKGLLHPPPVLSIEQLTQWRSSLGAQQSVVLVLGAGRDPVAPEYGEADLSADSSQRLRYGLWLARQLGHAPVMFSGGSGNAVTQGAPEAQIAQRVAERDHGRSLRWLETESRDTRENARLSLALLAGTSAGQRLLSAGGAVFLVTHGWHMPRAKRAFDEEVARRKFIVRIVQAPMGLAEPDRSGLQRWLPSVQGYQRVYRSLHEWYGRLAGA